MYAREGAGDSDGGRGRGEIRPSGNDCQVHLYPTTI